jgi:hypothetical protein
MGGGLLVIVRFGSDCGGGAIGGDCRLGTGELDRESVMARQLGRLRASVALQRLRDREVQPGGGGIAGAGDQRLANQGVRKGDRRLGRGHVVDEPLRQRLLHRALSLIRAEPDRPGRKANRRRRPDRRDRGQQALGVGVQPSQALLDEIGDRLGHRGLLERFLIPQGSSVLEVASQLAGEERVAGGARLQARRKPRRDRPSNPRPDQCRQSGRVEPGQAELVEIAGAA